MKCAIYCRLSREDDKMRRESESIRNQRDMLTSYAAEKNWEVFEVYSDDDYSGADIDRPGFSAMLKAAEEKRFDIILCKTQSRFTRDMEAVEKYIHKLFPIWGIRFVAVLDNIDTDDKANKKARQINGLVNEWYLEDLSENIRAVFEQKRRAGKYIASLAVYGYKKDPKDHNRLIIDSSAAENVRMIFSMYLSGLGTQKVADNLNALGVLPPEKYRQEARGEPAKPDGKWSATAVSRILRNEVYLGTTVQGMTKKQSYKTKKCVRVPENEWVRVEHTHEPIIGKTAFEAANQRLSAHTRSDGSGKPYPLAGKLFCTGCGNGFIKISHKYKGEAKAYLQCKSYAANRKNPACSKHTVKLQDLESIVTKQIQALIKTYYKAESHTNRQAYAQSANTYPKKELEVAKQRIERLSAAVRSLYIDKAEGEISAELFKEMSETILAERNGLENRVSVLERALQAKPQNQAEDFADIKQIDRLLCDLFIEKIEIGEDVAGGRTVRICWKV